MTFAPTELSLTLDEPAACAQHFSKGAADLALVPVGALLDWPSVQLLDRYCIGAEGTVDSVFIVSRVPAEQIQTLYLDPHSRTSNGLARVLFQRHWKRAVELRRAPDYLSRIEGTTAGVVIGDRAIAVQAQYPVVIDLAEAWQQYTGLPFTFAVWAYRPANVSAATLAQVQAAFEAGMAARDRVAGKWASAFEMDLRAAKQYLWQAIQYGFDGPKQQALSRYLTELAALEGTRVPVVDVQSP